MINVLSRCKSSSLKSVDGLTNFKCQLLRALPNKRGIKSQLVYVDSVRRLGSAWLGLDFRVKMFVFKNRALAKETEKEMFLTCKNYVRVVSVIVKI
jgi:hypothetical protein